MTVQIGRGKWTPVGRQCTINVLKKLRWKVPTDEFRA